MKNLSKRKILIISIVALLAFVMPIFTNQAFSAGAYFNTDPQDHPTLRTGNYSVNGPSCTTCWNTSVMANAGEIISFDVYYHNTSADTAVQTRVKANIPAGSFNSFSFTADLYAANATPITGSTLVTLSSSQSLTFIPGSVLWYPNRSATPVSLLYSQNGDEIITSGLNIGDVSAGWATQGHVTFRVQVGGGQQQQGQGQIPAVITNSATLISQNSANFNASINPNGSNTTAWFEYGTTQSLGSTIGNQTIGNGNASIDISYPAINLLSNTTYYYRAVASNQNGTVYGNTLSFTTQSQQVYGSVPTIATNSATSITQNSAVLNGSVNPNSASTNVWFEYGTTQSLGYTVGNQSVGNGNYNINITASISGLLSNTTYYYRAVASNQYGTSYGNILNFTTSQSQGGTGLAPIITTGSATSIYQNSATLNATVNPNNSNTNLWFEYGTTQSFGYTSVSQSVGSGNSSINTTGYISSLLSNTTYYYRAVASNQYGVSYGNTLSFTTQSQQVYGSVPTIATNSATSITQNSAVLNGSVNPNSASTNVWFEYGTTQSLGYTVGNQSVGNGNYNINITASISGLLSNTTYYYRAVASNQNGTVYGNTLSFSTIASQLSLQGSIPTATTNPATIFFTNSILLNGAVNANGAITTAWFEYGPTLALGQKTNSQPMGMGTIAYNYSYVLSNLTPNTTYYFRAVAQNAYGTSYGTILNFVSPAATAAIITTNNTASLTTTVKSIAVSDSLTVVLVSDVDKKEVVQGDEINYTAVYKNISNDAITDAKISITLPEGIDYQGANVDPSSQSAQNITFNIGKVSVDGQGSVSVKAKINNSAKAGELILNAGMDYVDMNSDSQLVKASSTIVVKDNGSDLSLTASLLDAMGSFFGSWLFNIILLAMVLGIGVYIIKYLKQ